MSETGFDLELRPSARAHRILFWMHLVPLVCLPFAVSSAPWLVALAVGFGLSWLHTRRHRAFGYGRGAIVRLRATGEGGWKVAGATGDFVDAELRGSTVIASDLVILDFELPGSGRRSRVLLGDETSNDGMRRLRARLLIQSH